ncbi:hypothetical protein HK104_001767 [Borealophlyctis nickersoniae]|nr:hypothetical protein HK104_001767 [Borealophlyctis nickersoniae]
MTTPSLEQQEQQPAPPSSSPHEFIAPDENETESVSSTIQPEHARSETPSVHSTVEQETPQRPQLPQPPLIVVKPSRGENILRGVLGFGDCSLEGMVDVTIPKSTRIQSVKYMVYGIRKIKGIAKLKPGKGAGTKGVTVEAGGSCKGQLERQESVVDDDGRLVFAKGILWEARPTPLEGKDGSRLDPPSKQRPYEWFENGTYDFPFTIPIPKDLPGTFHTARANVEYRISVTVTEVRESALAQYFSNITIPTTYNRYHTSDIEIPVPRFHPSILHTPPTTRERIISSQPSSRIGYDIILPTTIIPFDTTLPILLHVSRIPPATRIKSVRARIIQTLTIKHDNGRTHHTESSIVAEHKDKQPFNGAYWRSHLSLTVPARTGATVPTTPGTGNIQVHHHLQISFHTSSGTVSDLKRVVAKRKPDVEVPVVLHDVGEEALEFLEAYVKCPEDPVNGNCLGLVKLEGVRNIPAPPSPPPAFPRPRALNFVHS